MPRPTTWERWSRVRDHAFSVDEPQPLSGTDVAANPVEYALAALGSCQVITYQFWAAKLGVLTGPAERERYEDLKRRVDEHCPVLDLFRNPTPVTTNLR
ncbi:OsmC family protein [Amycolatopsis bartoniae]|nr:OsmC family protein [Amycolatopsis bartoniae]